MELEAIVNVAENEKLGNSCSARELHKFLEVGRDFTSWIKGRIKKIWVWRKYWLYYNLERPPNGWRGRIQWKREFNGKTRV